MVIKRNSERRERRERERQCLNTTSLIVAGGGDATTSPHKSEGAEEVCSSTKLSKLTSMLSFQWGHMDQPRRPREPRRQCRRHRSSSSTRWLTRPCVDTSQQFR